MGHNRKCISKKWRLVTGQKKGLCQGSSFFPFKVEVFTEGRQTNFVRNLPCTLQILRLITENIRSRVRKWDSEIHAHQTLRQSCASALSKRYPWTLNRVPNVCGFFRQTADNSAGRICQPFIFSCCDSYKIILSSRKHAYIVLTP